MAYADQEQNRTVAIGSVALIHAALGAALVSGLAVKFVPEPTEPPITIYDVKDKPPPPPEPTPEPLDKVIETKPASPPIVVPDAPVLTTTNIPIETTTTVLPPPPPMPPMVTRVEPPTPPTPPVNLSSAARVRGEQAGWFPQDAYPAAARRAGAEGRVGVSVDIGANGRVTACRVLTSSGDDDLDATTCRLAMRNGRFEPAKDAAGNKVGSTLTLRPVRWRLEE